MAAVSYHAYQGLSCCRTKSSWVLFCSWALQIQECEHEDCWGEGFCNWSALAMILPSHLTAPVPLRTAWLMSIGTRVSVRRISIHMLLFNRLGAEHHPEFHTLCFIQVIFFTGKLIPYHNADILLWNTYCGCVDAYKHQYFPCAHHMLDEANWISMQS